MAEAISGLPGSEAALEERGETVKGYFYRVEPHPNHFHKDTSFLGIFPQELSQTKERKRGDAAEVGVVQFLPDGGTWQNPRRHAHLARKGCP